MLRIVRAGEANFESTLRSLELRGEADLSAVEPVVRPILEDVRSRGDAAVLDACERLEKRRPEPLMRPLTKAMGQAALARLPAAAREAMELAARRIFSFHERQIDRGFRYDEAGATLGTRVRPVRRAGVYAPGGKARYPSSVLMSAIPAKVAGVRHVVVASPLRGDEGDAALIGAAHLAGVDAFLDAGGAQAIAAMAYGTATVPRVDVVVGPGNIYVACAKRLVSGVVRIDGIAGPSEILVLADDTANPVQVAADLLSQAEHDEDAYPLLVTTEAGLAEQVVAEVEKQLQTLPRKAIAQASIDRQGLVFVVPTRAQLAALADCIAAEHLALHVREPEALLEGIDAAGAAFIGASTPEAVGDYVAGPSHVLPTGGAVRFGAPLGVYDFLTRTSVIRYSPELLAEQADAVCTFARLEGLEAHARAVEARTKHRA